MERQHLAHLAEHLGGGPPGFAQALRGCNCHPLTLHKLGQRLHRWWIGRAHSASQNLYRSPLYNQTKPLPHALDGQAHFTYERSLWPVPLEQSNPPAGWRAEVVMCRSLEAAYWTGLTTLKDMLGAPQKLRSLAMPAKQRQLLDWMSGGYWQWSEAFGPTTFLSSLAGGRAGIFLCGPAALMAPPLLEAWKERPRGSQAILWLESPAFDWSSFLHELRDDPPWLTVLCQPWNAWRSLGLPLTCLGQLTFYAPFSPGVTGMTNLDTAAELSRRIRSVLGAGLSYPELSEWCWATRIPPDELAAYRKRLGDNAAYVKDRLEVEVDHQGVFRWEKPTDLKKLARLAILPDLIPGALGHGVREVEDHLQFTIGWRSVDPLIETLVENGRRTTASPPKVAPEREWPNVTRRRLLKMADQRTAPDLEQLESRLLAYDEATEALIFRSGMSAIASLWLVLEKLVQGPLEVATLGRYFETLFLQQVLQAPTRFQETPLPQAPIVMAESVGYDWELTPLDLGSLSQAQIVILDTTLTGQRLTISQLPRAPLVIRLFSGIKLDQQGLELENCGALLLAGSPQAVKLMAQSLRAVRTCAGSEPSALERRRLAPPFVFDPQLAQAHQDAVFSNNAWLAQRLTQVQGGLLARVVHPSLGNSQDWACAPFVVLHLKDSSIEAHRQLTAVLEYEAQRRKLPLGRGASFGFLDHRHEFVIPVLRENRALFKVAMGARQGDPREAIGQLLLEVLSYPDCASLALAYPDLQLASAPADWAAPSARLLEFLEGSD